MRPRPEEGTGGREVESTETGIPVNPWEERAKTGWVKAASTTTKRFLLDPIGAYDSTRERGGFRGPLMFALIVAAAASFLGELVDAIARIPLGLEGSGNMSDILDLKVNEVRVPGAAWFPAAALGVAGLGGCLLGLVVGIPVFVLVFPFVVLVCTGIMHACLKIVGGLRDSEAGYQGTWAAACYAAVAAVPGTLPMIGDWLALIWLGVLLGIGFWRLHHTTPFRAAMAVLLPLAIPAGLWLLDLLGVLTIE